MEISALSKHILNTAAQQPSTPKPVGQAASNVSAEKKFIVQREPINALEKKRDKRSTSTKPEEKSSEKNADGLSKRGKTYMAATSSFKRK